MIDIIFIAVNSFVSWRKEKLRREIVEAKFKEKRALAWEKIGNLPIDPALSSIITEEKCISDEKFAQHFGLTPKIVYEHFSINHFDVLMYGYAKHSYDPHNTYPILILLDDSLVSREDQNYFQH